MLRVATLTLTLRKRAKWKGDVISTERTFQGTKVLLMDFSLPGA